MATNATRQHLNISRLPRWAKTRALERRLAALRATGLLDSPTDERFDRLTRLARRVLHTPVALASLIDADRQFFLSSQGLGEPWATLRQTPLSRAFCLHVVESGAPLKIADARADALVRDNPAIEELGVIAYLAVPLALPDGCVVGALCAIDHQPRLWSADDQQTLADLAGAFMCELAAAARLHEMEAAQGRERRQREILDRIETPVYTTDADGRLTFFNEAAVLMWGWRPPLGSAQWCGSWRLFSLDGTPMRHDKCPMATTLREGRSLHGEAMAERPDGTRVPFAAYPTPLHDEAGALLGAVNVLVDISKRRDAELALAESEQRLRALVEAVPDAIVVTGEDGIIHSFSTAAERLFGYPAEEAVGQDVAMLMPSLPIGLHSAGGLNSAGGLSSAGGLASAAGGRVDRGRRKDGSIFPLELTLGEMRADGRRLFTGFMRDLTERQATAVRLQDLQTELLHVSRLSVAGEMASALAHELNQPLTAIISVIGAAQRMLARAEPGSAASADAGAALSLASEQALRAGQIVRRLRDFVVRGEADKQVEELPRLVEEAGALALVGAHEHGVRVTFRIDRGLPPVLIDRVQVQQVVVNLIRNALEAMAAHDAPLRPREIMIAVTCTGADEVEIAVEDAGPGLAPEIVHRLFEPFVSTKPDGMGMGLSICRSIVEAHDGRLWVEPNTNGGAVFRFTLQSVPSEAAP